MTKGTNILNNMLWDIEVSILRNRLIIKQLGIAIGIPFGLLVVLLLLLEAYYGVLIVALTLLLTAVLIRLVFRGTYDVHYEINHNGILCENQKEQAKRVKKLSKITFFFGLFSKNPTAAGAGLLSGTRTKVFISFKRIRKIKCMDNQKCIIIHGGFAENIAVFCTTENYESVKRFIVEKNNM